jgi:tRNA1(Val) A37 N6-methylase TrmN6
MEFSRREEELIEEELVIHYDERHFTEQYKALTRDYYPAF